jgi:CHAT domain-containing protein
VLPPAPARLVIVPDGPLHAIPFAALRDSATKQHLVENYVIEYAPSAALYLSSLARNRELRASSPPTVLVVGDPLHDLAGAKEEAEEIARMYGTKPLIGGEATVDAFFRNVRRSDIIHLAMHAVVNPEVPAHSTLRFAPSPAHSGALTAEELVKDLRLDHTRLAVLAACSSAGGLPVGPEGIAPLVRPILTAGVPAVIGSLSNVTDATAKDLLVSFHQHYRNSGDAAAALRAAQLEALRSGSPARESGLWWAMFEVIGHNAPADENDKGEPP